jgi:hypothetical protein
MQIIFIISEGRANGVVKSEKVEGVVKDFGATQRSRVHWDIKKFIREEDVFKGKDIDLEKMVELIAQSLTPPWKGSDGKHIFTMCPLNQRQKKISLFSQKHL